MAVRLGELAAAQVFDALHAWARARASHPDKAHAAVLVTETIGERYRGTLEALAEHLPLVVVELAVWRGETEAIVVPHVALAAPSVDLSTAPATAAATVLGALQATTSTAVEGASVPPAERAAPATVSAVSRKACPVKPTTSLGPMRGMQTPRAEAMRAPRERTTSRHG